MPNKPASTPPARPIAMTIALQVRITGMRRPQAPSPPAARVNDALRRAAQASPAVRAALRRQPVAAKTAATHLRKLVAGGGAARPASALRHGLAVAGAMGKVAAEMQRDFRKGGGQVRVESSVPLSEKAQHHVDAAERGLRKGGLGLLSAAYHGVQIARESRKAMRARGGARPQADAASPDRHPAPADGAHGEARQALSPMPHRAQAPFDFAAMLSAAREGAHADARRAATLHVHADATGSRLVLRIARGQDGRARGGDDD